MQTCQNCSYSNRMGVVFCENCGTSLIGNATFLETRTLKDKTTGELNESELKPNESFISQLQKTNAHGTSHFPEGGMLYMEIGHGSKPITIAIPKNILLGRRDAVTGSIPDVDLTPYAGYRMGVSRRHAEIRPNKAKQELYLWDLGSSNGTFLNGNRLMSHRPHLLHDGNNLRVGQLNIHIHFKEKKPADKKLPIEKPVDTPKST